MQPALLLPQAACCRQESAHATKPDGQPLSISTAPNQHPCPTGTYCSGSKQARTWNCSMRGPLPNERPWASGVTETRYSSAQPGPEGWSQHSCTAPRPAGETRRLVGASGRTQRVHREGGAGRGAWGVACTDASLPWALGKDALKACRCQWEMIGQAQVSWLGTVSGKRWVAGHRGAGCMPDNACRGPAPRRSCSAAGMHKGGQCHARAACHDMQSLGAAAPLTRTVKRYSCPFSRELMDSL